MSPRQPYRSLIACAMAIVAGRAAGQTSNPVYVDDSARAAELLHLARAQARDNAGEAVRLYQEILDDYDRKLVPWREGTPDHLCDVRQLVLADLISSPPLLERYAITQEGEAARLLESADSTRLAGSRSLTTPGLEMTLRLAQEAMESARFHAAIGLLDEALAHPALDSEGAAAAWLMRGTCAHFLGSTDRADEAAARLAALDRADSHAQELAQIRASDRGPDLVRGVTALDASDARDQQELVAQEIWLAPLPDSLLRRRYPDRPGTPVSPGYSARNRKADLTTAAPTAAGAAVFVNEGHVVRALDRYTGRPIWSGPYVDREQGSIGDRDADATGDMSMVTIEGDWLVTLTGHAQDRQRTGNGKVLCLSASTGRPYWSRTLHRVVDDDEYEGLFAHGRPLIVEGRVIVLARKVSRQSVTGCYVVALDLANNGELAWIRHVASSGGRHRTGRPFSSPELHDGDVLVSTAVGAVACLEARSGAIRWLRRDAVPVHDGARDRRPWEMRTLVATDERVVALSPDDSRILVLDRRTGDLVGSHDALSVSGWGRPAYLLGNDDFVFAVGSSIRAFTNDALDLPAWQVPAPPQSGDEGELLRPDDLQIAGRVQLAGDLLIVPTVRAVLAIDIASGNVVHELDVGTGGNPVAAEGQLILATGDELDAYMSFSRAVAMLRQRIEEDVADPEPAISLVQLATRVADLALVMDGAEHALRAIDQPENRDDAGRRVESRHELFKILLDDETTRLAATDDAGEALYGLIATVASGAEERTEHLLAYSDWLAERRPSGAAEPLQRILDDPILRATVRAERGGAVLRRAEAWVGIRLAKLVADHGPAVYAPLAETARLQLAAIPNDVDRDEPLLDIAYGFPLARAGIDAATEAAAAARSRGQHREALARLARAYQLMPTRDRAEPLLGHFVAFCVADDEMAAARAALQDIIARHGDLTLRTPAGGRVASEWLAALGPRPERTPRVGALPGEVRELPGRLVKVAAGARMPTDVALLHDGQWLRLLRGTDLAERWSIELATSGLTVLEVDARSLVLWIDDQSDPRILALDRNTGARLWSTPFLADHVTAPLTHDGAIGDRLPDGKTAFIPGETLCASDARGWYLVQRTGGVAAFDRKDGRIVSWSRDRTIDQVHHVIAHPLGLVLIGSELRPQRDEGTAELSPRVVVLDTHDGQAIHRLRPNTSTGVVWASIDGLGGLACASTEGIELIDIVTGSRRWTNVSFSLGDTNRGWRLGDRMLVETRTSSLMTVEDATGRMRGPFDIGVRGDWDPLQIEEAVRSDDRLMVRFRQRIVRYDSDGNVLGADVIAEDRDFRWLLPASDGFVAVSLASTTQRARQRSRGPIERTYALYRLSDTCRVERQPLEVGPLTIGAQDAWLVDGWVLLGTPDRTIAVALAPES